MSTLPLAALDPDLRAVVVSIDFEFAVRERLAALGVRAGRQLRVVRRMGPRGPLQIRVDHTDLILRGSEAKRIQVELLNAVAG